MSVMELISSMLALAAAITVLRFASNSRSKPKMLKVSLGLCFAAVLVYAFEFRLLHRQAKVWHKLRKSFDEFPMSSRDNFHVGRNAGAAEIANYVKNRLSEANAEM